MHHNPLPHGNYQLDREASQAAELEQLLDDNHKLSSSLVVLRQDLVKIQQEIGGLHALTQNIQKEGDIEIKGILDSVAKMNADLRAGETVKENLLRTHQEAQSLVKANHELTVKIKEVTEELERFHSNGKSIVEMHAELDSLMQERQNLHNTFKLEKDQNLKEVEEMEERERDIVRLVSKLEKLRGEVANSRNKANENDLNPNYGHRHPSSVQGAENYRVPPPPQVKIVFMNSSSSIG